jgi:hypothetical protein
MGKIKKGLTGILAGLALAGCNLLPFPNPQPTPKPVEYNCNITYEVIGSGNADHADISYGDEKYVDCNNPSKLHWICTGVSPLPGHCATTDTPCIEDNSQLPWSYTTSTCKGHPVKLGIGCLQNGALTLRIKKNGVTVAEKQVNWLGNLEYNIPGP